MTVAIDPFRMIEASSFSSDRALYREEQPFNIGVEVQIEKLFVYPLNWPRLRNACIGEEHVNLAVLLPHGIVEPIEIGQIGNVALHGSDVPSNFGDRSIERISAPPRDEYLVHPFVNEALRLPAPCLLNRP